MPTGDLHAVHEARREEARQGGDQGALWEVRLAGMHHVQVRPPVLLPIIILVIVSESHHDMTAS